MAKRPLQGVEALTFDVFGTVVDWLHTGIRTLKSKVEGSQLQGKFGDDDWFEFMHEWRNGYKERTKAAGMHGVGDKTLNVDVMHREILDGMLASERWLSLGMTWGDEDREELVLLWHRLDGWPDSSKGLYKLKKRALISTLSNGNVRLLADMAKHADLPWDVILSGELLGGFKPDPKVYLGALYHLSVPPERCAMVAAHIYDLRFAAEHGYRTVYVRRSTEEPDIVNSVKSKAEGGEVDVVVDGLEELARLLEEHNGHNSSSLE